MLCAAAEHPAGAGKRRRPLKAALAFPRPSGGHRLWSYLFLLPILVLLIMFKFLPMLRALYLSFTSYDLLNPPRFVGLQNYLTLIHDPLFHQSVGATVYYVLGTCIPVWFVSLALALALDAALPAGSLLRLMLVIPAVVPVVVYATIWRFMLHPYGLVNTGLQAIGLPAINWLADSRAIMPGVILASEWRFVPYFMVIYLAGLQGIPREYHEAAAIDGASRWERFRFVTLPLLRPMILLVVVVSMVLTSKVFTNVLIISGGGPDGATRVLSLFIYQTGFQYLKMGLASAASMLLLLATLAFTLVQLRLLREDTRG
jgi:multiple sugar transport system permease protein